MKILAIRLKNLASLAGPFEIDFTAEPLASAGLFAITGPTGAGKSTLLDALCLALFGAVPRLNNIGRETKLRQVRRVGVVIEIEPLLVRRDLQERCLCLVALGPRRIIPIVRVGDRREDAKHKDDDH